MKKLSVILSALLALLLCGCGIFDKEYSYVVDYAPTVQNDSSDAEKITVRNIGSLKQAIRTMITKGDAEGKIIFDAAYDGDPTEDMSKACWQVRTQDALCAYCVENISYELTKIVTYYEAKVSVSYSDYVENDGHIERLPYSTGIELYIKNAIEQGSTKLVMLVNHSSYSAEDVVSLASEVYRQNPASAPREPFVSVNMYSGSSMQRLYEVNLRYGLSTDELSFRKSKLDSFAPFADEDYSSLDDAQRALVAYDYLTANCIVDAEASGTVYDALIGRRSNSEGLALAFVELCRQLEVECRVVYGQRDWQEHCWNIVKLDENYYHVDAGLERAEDDYSSFMRRDEAFWEHYRWDMSSYPACTGTLEYEDALISIAEPEEDLPPEEEILPEENLIP